MTADSVVYRPNRRFRGRDTFKFVGNDGAADSQPATATVRVRPQNRFSMRLGKFRNGRLVVVFKVRAQGRMATGLRARVGGRNVRWARSTKRAKRAGRLRVTLRLKRPARARLARALRGDGDGRMRGTVRARFKPTGGTSRTQTRKLTVRR